MFYKIKTAFYGFLLFSCKIYPLKYYVLILYLISSIIIIIWLLYNLLILQVNSILNFLSFFTQKNKWIIVKKIHLFFKESKIRYFLFVLRLLKRLLLTL